MVPASLVLAAVATVPEPAFFGPPYLFLAAFGAAISWRVAFLDEFLRAARQSGQIQTIQVVRNSFLSGAGYFAFAMLAARLVVGFFVERHVTAEVLSVGLGLAGVALAKPVGLLALFAPAMSTKSSPRSISMGFDEKRARLSTVNHNLERETRELSRVIGDVEVTVGSGEHAPTLRLPEDVVRLLIEQPSEHSGPLSHYTAELEAARTKIKNEALISKLASTRKLYQEKQLLVSELAKYNELPQQIIDEQHERQRQRELTEARFIAEMSKRGAEHQQNKTDAMAAIQKREKLLPKSTVQKLAELVEDIHLEKVAEAVVKEATSAPAPGDGKGIAGAIEAALRALAQRSTSATGQPEPGDVVRDPPAEYARDSRQQSAPTPPRGTNEDGGTLDREQLIRKFERLWAEEGKAKK